MGKRTFSREFKVEAVRLVKERGVSYSQAARELGIHVNVLRGWVGQHEADPEGSFGGTSPKKTEALELAQLRKELARVKMERDILKKAVAYFAKEST